MRLRDFDNNCEFRPRKFRLVLAEEQRAALKERSATLEMINKENVREFAKSLDDLKQQFTSKMKR